MVRCQNLTLLRVKFDFLERGGVKKQLAKFLLFKFELLFIVNIHKVKCQLYWGRDSKKSSKFSFFGLMACLRANELYFLLTLHLLKLRNFVSFIYI